MTPPSIHRIQSDDDLLDRIGARATTSGARGDDGLTDLLAGWVDEVDDVRQSRAGKTAGRYARTRRGGVRAGAAAAVLVGTLSVSGMAAAMTSTTVPVLHQLGQVTRGLVFEAPPVETQHQTSPRGAAVSAGTPTSLLTAPPAPGTPQDLVTLTSSSDGSTSVSASSIFRRAAPGSTSSRRPTATRTAPPASTSTPAPSTTTTTTPRPPRSVLPTTVAPTAPSTTTGAPPTTTSVPTRTTRPIMPTSPSDTSSSTTTLTSPTPRQSRPTSSSDPSASSS